MLFWCFFEVILFSIRTEIFYYYSYISNICSCTYVRVCVHRPPKQLTDLLRLCILHRQKLIDLSKKYFRVCGQFVCVCDQVCFLGDSRREIQNLVILNDEKHCFARERRSDKKHASPRCALRCKQSSALFLLRVVVKIISGYVMKLKNSSLFSSFPCGVYSSCLLNFNLQRKPFMKCLQRLITHTSHDLINIYNPIQLV